ncbi:MAG: AAA family ATPase [Gammaproteobacteria bacterium]|nr:AAA family ATPase [Gammaproteobacteria bacterium]
MSKVAIDKWQSLGFKRKPFIDLSRTKPFLTSKQRQQLTLLEELVRDGGHLLLLLGVSGVGKTTFLNTFKKNMAQPAQQAVIGLCEMQGDGGVNIAMVKALLAKHLAITDGIHADTFMQSLKARLAQMAQSNERFLLIVDDAHHLPAETVRFMLDLMSDLDETAHSLNILLAGRMQLEHLFASSGASDWGTGSSLTLVLEPLNEEEVLNYIKHGLRQAGYKGTMPFSKSQIIELSINSKGILARLVVMAVGILETKGRDKGPSSWAISPKALWASVALVALVAVGTIAHYASAPEPTVAAGDDTKVVTVEKQGAWVKTITRPVDTAANDIAPKITIVDDTSAPRPQTVSNTTVAAAVVPVANTTPIANDNSAATKAVTVAAVSPKVVTANAPISNARSVNPQIAQTTPVVPRDVPIMTPIPNDNELRSQSKPVQAAPVAPKAPSSKAAVSPDKVITPSKASANKTAFKAQGYTIQIAGGYDLKLLQKTVCQLWTAKATSSCSVLPDNLHYIRTLKDDKDWYIATLGQYNSSAEAAKQLQQLPVSVQKNTPWARAFAQIPNATVVE